MNIDQKIVARLQELIEVGEKVLLTKSEKTEEGTSYLGEYAVNYEMGNQWGTSCLGILERVFGKGSDHYTRFKELGDKFKIHSGVKRSLGVLKAAKDDYEHGYLFDARVLIQAEVFDDFLEQAKHLFDNGYHAPAAVIAGSVLEDGLRKLCVRKGIALPSKPKLDTMNAELAKAGVYNILVQKKITALADLRNKAAHGRWSEFTPTDVEQMLAQVRSFMADHFS
jgi:HEPN domain-containing protein